MKAMSIPKIVVTVIQILSGLFLIAVVLLQSGKSAGLSGAIAGGMDTFMAKNKAKTWDAKLAKWTKWVAILFIVLTLVLSLMKALSDKVYHHKPMKQNLFPPKQ